ncbi:unnamed protein product [Ostreobium quekettii]|uniref:PH domain-containing protein n=1 Tax=Ostreobium quekettii TaxID=121088 RepID=A0A8S1JFN5_9CHLO|nr:unnamed protein product [Ostreobium quekettii]
MILQTSPGDFDAVYNHGLVLQELAARVRMGIEGGEREGDIKQVWQLLREACDRYSRALEIRPSFHAAQYNWGVALSELAGLMKRADGHQALYHLHDAALRYSQSLQGNPNNPQALNNWGLVLQEVSSFHTDLEVKLMLAAQAIDKFRRSLRLQPDFDHGCYNLGTVFYTHASTLRTQLRRTEDTIISQAALDWLAALSALNGSELGSHEAVDAMMQKAAQYIVLAWALQPGKEVYSQSVKVVQNMLPRPFLRVGYLKAPKLSTLGGPTESWERQFFALDQGTLRSGSALQLTMRSRGRAASPPIAEVPTSEDDYVVDLADVISAVRCLELSLPEGEAFWIGLKSRPQGMYFVAEDKETAEEWVDVLTLMQNIHSQQKAKSLATVLSPGKAHRSTE